MSDTFIRSVDFSLRDDGRTLHGRIVPYGEVADIAEIDDETEGSRSLSRAIPPSFASGNGARIYRSGWRCLET